MIFLGHLIGSRAVTNRFFLSFHSTIHLKLNFSWSMYWTNWESSIKILVILTFMWKEKSKKGKFYLVTIRSDPDPVFFDDMLRIRIRRAWSCLRRRPHRYRVSKLAVPECIDERVHRNLFILLLAHHLISLRIILCDTIYIYVSLRILQQGSYLVWYLAGTKPIGMILHNILHI